MRREDLETGDDRDQKIDGWMSTLDGMEWNAIRNGTGRSVMTRERVTVAYAGAMRRERS